MTYDGSSGKLRLTAYTEADGATDECQLDEVAATAAQPAGGTASEGVMLRERTTEVTSRPRHLARPRLSPPIRCSCSAPATTPHTPRRRSVCMSAAAAPIASQVVRLEEEIAQLRRQLQEAAQPAQAGCCVLQ